MKSHTATLWVIILFCVSSCTKNDTRFYEEGKNNGLSIFSNTGNNVMSCYINGRQWRTNDRSTYLLSSYGTRYELNFYRFLGTIKDVVQIRWDGHYGEDKTKTSSVILMLSIPHNSFYSFMSRLQNQRIPIDSSSGNYFMVDGGSNLNNPTGKGNGNIYFQTAQFDSIAPGIYTGSMSGLFEADFGSLKVTKGRFDHLLTQEQIR